MKKSILPEFYLRGYFIKVTALMLAFSFLFTPLTPLFAQETPPISPPTETETPVSETTPESQPATPDPKSATEPTTISEEQTPPVEEQAPEEETPPLEEETPEEEMMAMTEGLESGNSSYSRWLPKFVESTGALIQEYNFVIPPGRNGLQPNLKLGYNNQTFSSDSVFGYGWSINIPFIQRINKTGVENLYSQTHFLSSVDGELISLGSGNYAPKVEDGSFSKYNLASNVWTVTKKDGTVYKYGTTAAARQDNPGDSSEVFTWLIQEIRDTNDNYIKYEYHKDNGQIYPSKITYTGNGSTDGIFEIEFARESRTDVNVARNAGFLVKTDYRISSITVEINGSLVKTYELDYGAGLNGYRSVLTSITESGKDESNNTTTLPPWEFDYNLTSGVGWTTNSSYSIPSNASFIVASGQGNVVVDVNGDGLSDIIQDNYTGGTFVYLNEGDGTGWNSTSAWSLPSGAFIRSGGTFGFAIADINGDQLPDLLNETYNGSSYDKYVYLNNGSGWTDVTSSWNMPSGVRFLSTSGVEGAVVDINGDGLADILTEEAGSPNVKKIFINRGDNTGWDESSTWSFPSTFSLRNTGTDGKLIGDVNGDGLADLMNEVYSGGQYTKYLYLNNGATGWDQITNWTMPNVRFINNTSLAIVLVDINGDNWADLISQENDNQYIHLNDGDNTGWTLSTSWDFPSTFDLLGNGSTWGAQVADVNGDGLVDLLNQNSSNKYVHLNDSTRADQISLVTQPSGGTTEIEYKPSAQYLSGSTLLNPDLPFVIDTVSQITYNDGLGNSESYTYSYENGEYYYDDPLDRKFAGFYKVTKTNDAGHKEVNFLHQGNATSSTIGEYSDHVSKIGQVFRKETQDGSGNAYLKTINKWDKYEIGTDHNFVKLARVTELTYDGDSDHKDKAEEYTYENTYGNMTEKVEYGEVTGSNDGSFTDTGTDKFTTTYSYASNTTPYIVGLISQDTKVDQSSNKVKENKYYYDGQSHGNVTDGNLTKQEMWKSGSSYADIEKIYNTTYGIVTQEKDGRDKTTDFTYDSYNLYPTTVTNHLDQETDYAYDYSLGKPKQVTDANDRVFQTVYDGLDRIKEEKQPDLTTPSTLVTKTAYTYTDTSGAVKVQRTDHLDGSTSVDTYTYFDGRKRPIQVRKEMEDGNYAVTDTVYNNIGKIHKESVPYSSSGSAKTAATTTSTLLTTYSYDPIQRVSSIATPIGTTSNAYDDWKTSITDPRSKVKHLYNDAYGNLKQVDEINSSSTYTTTYEWNGNNLLTKVTDALGNVRNFTYDGMDRRLTAQDLHAAADGSYGTYTYTYDDASNLTSVVDPKSQTINFTYDDLNRISAEDYTGASGTEVSYSYDSGTDGVGRLTSVTAPGANTTYAYFAGGLLKQEIKNINSTNYQTDYTYDRQGNQLEITSPDSSKVKYTYNTSGQLETVQRKESSDGSFSDVVTDLDYGPHGKVTYKAFANCAESTYTYDAAKMYRLSNILTTSEGCGESLMMGGSMSEGQMEEMTESSEGTTEITTSTYPVGTLDTVLQAMSQEERASIKGEQIASVTAKDTYSRASQLKIEIVDIQPIEGGVQVFARVWSKNKQIGFGIDGTVDIERFRIINPPVLVPDPKGSIIRTWTDNNTGQTYEKKLREDPQEALLQVLEQTIVVKKEKFPDTNIVPGKVGNTTSTFYPDGNPESTSVDSVVSHFTGNGSGVSWSTLRGAAGTSANDTGTADEFAAFSDDSSTTNWKQIKRGVFLFDTSSIPDADSISSATFSVYGSLKADPYSNSPNLNVYSSAPASNTVVVAGDFDSLGTTAYSDTAITYSGFSTSAYNNLAFNATGIAAISKTGVSKFGTRNANYDVANVAPTSSGNNQSTYLYGYYADQTGTTNDPKLVVEHAAANNAPTAPTSLLTEGATNPTNITDTTPEFSAIYNDPDSGDTGTHYRIQVSTVSNFSSTHWDSGQTALGTNVTQGNRTVDISYSGSALTPETTYYWRIKLWDDDGAEGAWSTTTSTFSLETPNNAPTAPTSLLTEGSTNPPFISDSTPEFSAIYNDPDDGDTATHYRIQVSTSSTFSSTYWDSNQTALGASVTEGNRMADVSYSGSSLAAETIYYWRIKFWDDSSAEGAWSSASTFVLASGGDIQNLIYTYDANSNITEIIDASGTDSAKTVTYAYDDLNRLTSATATNVASGQSTYTHTYTYDAIGNLLTRSDGAGTYSYSGTGNADPHAATSIGSINYTYDDNGNMLTETSGLSNTWDYNNRLTQAMKSGVTSTYAYDHTGQRVKMGNGTTTNYYPTKLYNTNGTTPTKSVYAGDVLVATVKGTGGSAVVQYEHNDHLNSTNVTTNSAGDVVELLDYYPFGNSRITSGSYTSQKKYLSEHFDPDTSLSYLNARFYQPSTGRFLSQDPVFRAVGNSAEIKKLTKIDQIEALKDPQSFNSYSYARNNPIRFSDPEGLWWKELFTGRQSMSDFSVEVGQATQYLTDNNSTWNYAVSNPVKAGLAVGVVGTAAAVPATAGVAGITSIKAGVSASYIGKMAVGSTLYGYVAKNALDSLPDMVKAYAKFDIQDTKTWKAPAVNTALMYGPDRLGEHISAMYDIVDSIVNIAKDTRKVNIERSNKKDKNK